MSGIGYNSTSPTAAPVRFQVSLYGSAGSVVVVFGVFCSLVAASIIILCYAFVHNSYRKYVAKYYAQHRQQLDQQHALPEADVEISQLAIRDCSKINLSYVPTATVVSTPPAATSIAIAPTSSCPHAATSHTTVAMMIHIAQLEGQHPALVAALVERADLDLGLGVGLGLGTHYQGHFPPSRQGNHRGNSDDYSLVVSRTGTGPIPEPLTPRPLPIITSRLVQLNISLNNMQKFCSM